MLGNSQTGALARNRLPPPQAPGTLFQNTPQSSPASAVPSCTEQIIRKPQIMPNFHPELQSAIHHHSAPVIDNWGLSGQFGVSPLLSPLPTPTPHPQMHNGGRSPVIHLLDN